MKSIHKLIIIGLLATLASTPVFAQLDTNNTSGPFFGKHAKGKWLIGIKAGKIDNNAEDVDDSDAIGLVLGYEFARPVGIGGSSTIELEYISGDETESLDGFASFEPEMLNLFLTYRSPGTLYFKFKLGLSYSNVDVRGLFDSSFEPTNDLNNIGTDLGIFTNEDSINNFSRTDVNSREEVGIAGGIGLGYRIQDFGTIELEHVSNSDDNDLSLTTISAIGRF